MTLSVNDKTQLGILVVAVASLFWGIGFYSGSQKADVIKQKLELSEFADNAKLSDLISTMRKTSDELSKNISSNNLLLENSTLKNELNKKTIENESLTNDIKVKEKFISDLGLSHGTFSMRASETKILFDGSFIISLSVPSYSSAIIVINNESIRLDIGKYYEFKHGGNQVKLLLESSREYGASGPGEAVFTLLENSSKPKDLNATN